MSDKELRNRLLELHRQLSEVGEVDADLQPLLKNLRDDIEAAMARTAPDSLSGRLAEAVERFELSHPQLATAMGAVADQLARMGI